MKTLASLTWKELANYFDTKVHNHSSSKSKFKSWKQRHRRKIGFTNVNPNITTKNNLTGKSMVQELTYLKENEVELA